MRTELKLAAFVATMTLVLSGCASNPDSTSTLKADAIQSETNSQIANVKQALDQASTTLAASESNELSWFADEQVSDAKKALAKAKEYYAEFELDPAEADSSSGFFSSKTNLEAANESLGVFHANIDKAEAIRSAALSTLAQAFDYRQRLKDLEAESYFPNTVIQLDNELKKLVDYVADDDISAAINAQPNLVTKQRTLEVKVVTTIYLAAAEKELARLKSQDIADFAPQTLAQAAASLTATKAFIAAQPRATDQITEKANATNFALKHAEQVAFEVKKLRALPQKVYERYILSIENILLSISQTLGAADGRDKVLSEQGRSIVNFIKDNKKNEQASAQTQQQLQAKLTTQQNRLTEQAGYLDSVREKVANLTLELQAAKAKQTQLEEDLQAAKTKPVQAVQSPTETKQPNAASTDAIKAGNPALPTTQPLAVTTAPEATATVQKAATTTTETATTTQEASAPLSQPPVETAN